MDEAVTSFRLITLQGCFSNQNKISFEMLDFIKQTFRLFFFTPSCKETTAQRVSLSLCIFGIGTIFFNPNHLKKSDVDLFNSSCSWLIGYFQHTGSWQGGSVWSAVLFNIKTITMVDFLHLKMRSNLINPPLKPPTPLLIPSRPSPAQNPARRPSRPHTHATAPSCSTRAP